MRINQFLSHSLNITRKEADKLIQSRKVSVDGVVVELGSSVKKNQSIKVALASGTQTIVVHQPAKIVIYKTPFCFSNNKQALETKKKSIFDFIPKLYSNYTPLGQLDYMSEGVLVLVNPDNLDNEQNSHLQLQEKDFNEEFILIFDSAQNIEVIAQDLKGVKVIEKLTVIDQKVSGYEFVIISDKASVVKITKNRTRASLPRQLTESGLNVYRCIRIRDGHISLTPELYKNKILVLE